ATGCSATSSRYRNTGTPISRARLIRLGTVPTRRYVASIVDTHFLRAGPPRRRPATRAVPATAGAATGRRLNLAGRGQCGHAQVPRGARRCRLVGRLAEPGHQP